MPFDTYMKISGPDVDRRVAGQRHGEVDRGLLVLLGYV